MATFGVWGLLARRYQVSARAAALVSILTTALGVACSGIHGAVTQNQPGLDLVIIYDTSGSMEDPVSDSAGGTTPKHVVASRALRRVLTMMEAYALEAQAERRAFNAGALVFKSGAPARAVPFGPFRARAFHQWLSGDLSPRGGTPLGRALGQAGRWVLSSPLRRNHIVVITDGINTVGPQPEDVLRRIHRRAASVGGTVAVHLLAFDVKASLFDPLRSLGATVVEAADENQLSDQLAFIMEKKILLEAEELPPSMPSPSP